MRSHATHEFRHAWQFENPFQYRKRYEVTCDIGIVMEEEWMLLFQYRKRYEVTCDTINVYVAGEEALVFQYRKRYEVTCDEPNSQGQGGSG